MTDAQRWLMVMIILVIGVLVYYLASVLVPFVVAILLAYFFNPIVDRLVEWHLPRVLGVVVVFLIMFLILLCLIFLVVPLIEKQVIVLIDKIPAINAWFVKSVWPWVDQHFNVSSNFDPNQITTTLTKYLSGGGNFITKLWIMASSSGMALISFITSLVLIPVVAFYLLCDWSKITQAASKLLPRHSEKDVVQMVKECGDVLAAFFRGQLLVMLCLGVIYAAGLWLVGLDVVILVGLIAGLLSIVPYLGFVIGIVMALIASFLQFHAWAHIFLVVGVFAVGELAESFILIPWLVGDRVGLHPIAVIFALLAGGELFGFVGILLAVPVSAVILVFLRYWYTKYLDSRYYKV